MFNFPENVVTRTAIGRECLTALRGIPYENLGLNSFQLRRKRELHGSLLQLQPCSTPWTIAAAENLFVWQRIDDRDWYWQWLLLAMDIEEIWMMYGDQILFSSSWSNIVPEFLIRYCSRLADVNHWAKMLMLDTWPVTTTQPCSAKRCSR